MRSRLFAEMAEKRANPSDTAAAGGSASTSAEAAPASLSGRSSPDQDEPVTKDDITTERESTWAHISDDESEVVMCVVSGGGKVGLSFYIVETGHVHVMADTAERDDYSLLKRVMLQVEPNIVILSARADDHMLKAVNDYAKPSNESDQSCEVATVEMLPSSEFRIEQCRRRILTTPNLPGVPKDATEEERLLQLSSLLSLESINMVRSFGVLLKYVEKKRLGVELEDESVRVPLLALKSFSLDNLMVMDTVSYSALQIFLREAHPSVYKAGKSGFKEGLSLFGIMNRTKSPLGKKLFKLWFLRPLRDMAALKQRQDAVAFFTASRNDELASTLHDCIKHIKNIPRILTKMTAGKTSLTDWNALYKTAYNGVFVADLSRSLPKDVVVFRKVAHTFPDELQKLASLLNKVIDFDESATQQRFCVKPNIDEELDQRKALFAGLPDLMSRVAQEELNKLERTCDISECSVVYFPQLGYLLTVASEQVAGKDELLEQNNLEFVFESNNLFHFKSDKTREMDRVLGDTKCEIQDHETAIMYRLQEVVLERAEPLISIMELSAELDCLLTLALFAKEHNCVRPELTEDNIIYIKAGRHPMQELCVDTFVPNDSVIDLEHGRIKLITGANASGKSVYLKQVGLIVFMAQIGSFVPAEGAKIGLMSHIFTRIQTQESVSVALSTFMLDLNQVSLALRESTDRSLVLLDEFGKGTATVDGVSLLAASLRHWIAQGSLCPNVLVSTHFYAILHQKLLPDTPLVEYLVMEVLNEGEDMVFLYQLVRGQSDSSHACHVATMMGISDDIVKRAIEVSDLIRRNEPVTKSNPEELQAQHKRCAEIASRFMELDLEKGDVYGFLKDITPPKPLDI